MSKIMTRSEGEQIIREYGNIDQLNHEKTVIYSITEIASLKSILSHPIKVMIDIAELPGVQWDPTNPQAIPEPKEIGVATIRVRLLRGKAWMDGTVATKIKNTGDVNFSSAIQDKVTFQETKSSKRLKYVQDAKKSIGELAEGKTFDWDISWKVDGIWNIFRSLISLLQTGKMRTTFTCRFNADYVVNGKAFFVIPQTKTETFDKSYNVKADVTIVKFKTDITW